MRARADAEAVRGQHSSLRRWCCPFSSERFLPAPASSVPSLAPSYNMVSFRLSFCASSHHFYTSTSVFLAHKRLRRILRPLIIRAAFPVLLHVAPCTICISPLPPPILRSHLYNTLSSACSLSSHCAWGMSCNLLIIYGSKTQHSTQWQYSS
jgi:hypothetical protein